MTVASTTNRKTYTGDNVSTSFATSPVIFYATSDLQVRVTVIATGVSTLLTLNTHYTVSGGAGATGTVSLAGGSSPHGALLSTEKLVILRVLPLTQASDFVNNNNSDAEVLEAALDKLTDVDQQIQEQADRAIRFASGDVSGTTTELPDVTTRAGRMLGFDALGVLTTIVMTAGTSLVDFASSLGSSLIGFIQAGTGAVLRTMQDKNRDHVSVFDFMTAAQIADVKARTLTLDVTAAIQAAINTGKGVIVPDGSYSYTQLYFDTCPYFVGFGNNRSILVPTAVAGNALVFGLNGVSAWGYFAHFSVAGNATTLIGIKLGTSAANYSANLRFDEVRVTGFTGVGAAGVYGQCVQDAVFRDCVIQNNYRNFYRPDTTAPNGFLTTLTFEGRAGIYDGATGEASFMIDGEIANLTISEGTIRSCAKDAIRVGTSANNANGNRLILRDAFLEFNNTSGTGVAEINIAGPTGAHNELILEIEHSEFHAQNVVSKTLSLNRVVAKIKDTSGLDPTLIVTTANTSLWLEGNDYIWNNGATYDGAFSSLLGQVFVFDKEYSGLTSSWFTNGKINFQGTQTNDNAPVGKIGEVVQSVVSAAANTAATNVYGNITSISLTAGDWNLTGQVEVQMNGATMTGSSVAVISVNSGNTSTDHVEGDNSTRNLPPSAVGSVCTSVVYRLLLTATTTVYLKVLATFSAGQPQALGTIRARRMR